jgi:prepilin-type N-terminal cleavage/methylation domain-containing protein
MTNSRQGFTLLEVIVATVMISVVMIAMSTILMNYSATRTKINRQVVAQQIVQSELDDVLLHTQIENSLISDPPSTGRSRPVYLQGNQLTVSNYFYYNFPASPDHNIRGMLWSGNNLPANQNRFAGNAFYDFGGGRLYDALSAADPRVVYVGRFQLFGSATAINNNSVETYINGATSSTVLHGTFVDTIATPSYLIADTQENRTTPAPSWYFDTSGAQYAGVDGGGNLYGTNVFREKIFVVRLYDNLLFRRNAYNFLVNLSGGGTQELTEIEHGYVVMTGKVRL